MQRLSALDGLRAIAILLVVGIHAYGWPLDGQLGVDMFFVLSGYLITLLLLREHDRAGRVSLTAFYKRRARRLLPALLVLLTVFLTVAVVRHDQARLAALSALTGLGFSMNLVRAWNLHPTSNGIGHLWSLAAEDQFYLVWPPLLFLLAQGKRRVAAVVLLAVLAAMMIQEQRLYHGAASIRLELGPDTRAVGLPIGCLLAIAYASPIRDRLARVAFWFLPAAIIVIVAFALAPAPPRIFSGWDTVFCVCCAILIVRALVPSSHTARLLGLAPFAYLGRISYSLYLWHFPVLVWLGYEGVGGFDATFAVALSLVAAVLSYHLVEQPFRHRGASVQPQPAPALATT